MRWFLPATPDVVGLLRRQLAVTVEGIDAFAAWAAGEDRAGATVLECEHRADEAKRELYRALREAFVTPLDPEDLFALSRGLDHVLDQAKDAVREAEVMACEPDAALAAMAAQVAAAVRELDGAVAALEPRAGATAHAEAAIRAARRIEHVYRAAMGELLRVEDLREVMARRELYRRAARIGETVIDVAERVLYAVVKEA
jgi:uncharacterized protein Yka (UPF0111/DUF47 family)